MKEHPIDRETPVHCSGSDPEWSAKRLLLWGAGFVFLFAVNAVVELLILPLIGLENTPRNDIYFQSWWVVVGFWLVFGNTILSAFDKKSPDGDTGTARG